FSDPGPVFHTIVSIKNDGHYFCRAGGNRPDGLNEPVTLKPHYLSVLHPCIVWFEADIVYEKGVLETALSYAYTSVRDLPPDGNATFGIDCDGKSVSRSAIARIEFLQPGQM
ncbi:hypothetical protein QTA23_25635, partial [Escherichia coli]|nr:hypothetical protein [Escherichia coli]